MSENGLGTKITWAILTGLISIMMIVFLNLTYGMSQSAVNKSNQNGEDIVRLQQCYANIEDKISEIRNIQIEHLKVSQNNNVEIQRLIEVLKLKVK
jgi:hypothetical protein